MRVTEDWLRKYEAKHAKPSQSKPAEGVEKESQLHNDILEECRLRGWIALHGSVAHRTFRTAGEFDFTILASDGKVFLLECKTKTGKLSEQQFALHHWAKQLGHNPQVIRSLSEFYEAIK